MSSHPSGPIVMCFAAATVATVIAAFSWRAGLPRKAYRVLWEGDKEARARTRQLKNVASAREFVDEVEGEVAELERLLDEATERMSRREAQSQHEKLAQSLSKNITDVLVHLDNVNGDETVRAARKRQVSRALSLGVRIRDAAGESASNY